MQWDAGWYERIVAYGYHVLPSAAPGHPVVYLQAAFYPGYPLIARGVFDVVHLFGVGVAGAMILTNQALVFVMAFLAYSMVMALTSRTDIAVRTVHYPLLYPFAYFLLAPYSETAFLTFVAGFVWALTARRYVTAGLLAAVAGATRPVGFVLPLVLALDYLEQHDWNIRTIKPRIVFSVVLACVGAGAFALYQWAQFGDPFYSQTASRVGWASSFTLNIWHVLNESFTHSYLSAGSIQGIPVETFINLPLVAAFAVLTVLVWRRFGVALGLMCASFIIVPCSVARRSRGIDLCCLCSRALLCWQRGDLAPYSTLRIEQSAPCCWPCS